jgi:hypothetical protein
MAFIGMPRLPPVTGPTTFGTATAVFNGRVVEGAGDVDEGVDAVGLADDEHPAAETSANTLNTAVARTCTVASLAEQRRGP